MITHIPVVNCVWQDLNWNEKYFPIHVLIYLLFLLELEIFKAKRNLNYSITFWPAAYYFQFCAIICQMLMLVG